MSTINQTLKVITLRIFPAVLIAIGFSVSLQSCQKDELDNGPGKIIIPFDDPILYWGHQTFSRGAGKPVTETVTISGADIVNFEGCLHLKIRNREDKLNLVSKTVVKIDGKQVASPGDFKNTESIITKEICGKTGDFTLEVELRDDPGSTVEVWIEGIMKNPVTDTRDGNIYPWVKIGDQIWMAKNMAYLPAVHHPSDSSILKERYWVHGYSGTDVNTAKATDNYKKYGVLYNSTAALAGRDTSSLIPSGVKGICPEGWHLPSNGEWLILKFYLSDNGYGYNGNLFYLGKVIADKTSWKNSENPGDVGNNPETNNSTGFSGLAAGTCAFIDPYFFYLGEDCQWWSSTVGDVLQNNILFFNCIRLFYKSPGMSSVVSNELHGKSVRCIRDYN